MQTVKIVNASQAHCINQYTNTKCKLWNCNANIYFNKMCLEQKLVPKYSYIKLNRHNRYSTKRLENQIHTLKIKNELKFWYTKKQHLNKTLYKLHLKNSNEWKNLWDTISQIIDKKLELKMNKKYNTLNKKLKN
jgi:hypothetical protein